MKKAIRLLLGCGIGALTLWLLCRGTDWAAVYASIRGAGLGWLMLVQVFIWLSFFARAQRWSYIVRASGPVAFRHIFSAAQIGQLVNFTLPLRAGDVTQALVLSRLTGFRVSTALAKLTLDRVADIIGVIAIMLVAVLAFRPGGDVVIPAAAFATQSPIVISGAIVQSTTVAMSLALAAVLAALALLYLKQAWVVRLLDTVVGVLSQRFAQRLHGLLVHFAEGMHVLRSPSALAKVILFSVGTWGMSVAACVPLLLAFGIPWAWYSPFVIVALLAAALSVPGAPGFVGQYHVPVVVALVMLDPHVAVADAKAMAIVAHFLTLIHVIIAGVLCLAWERVGLLRLERECQKAEEGHATRAGHMDAGD